MIMNPEQDPIVKQLLGDIHHKWGWLLALGILFVILGTVGLGMAFALTMASMLFFGFLMIFGGVFQLFHYVHCRGWKSILWHILVALAYIIGGIIVVARPMLASSVFTIIIAVVLMMVGTMRIVMSLQMRGIDGWWWSLLSGIISVIFGGMIMTAWPVSGMWLIGLLIAIDLIVHGWAYVFLALSARKLNLSE